MTTAYAAVHAASIADPEGFWLSAARAIDWETAPQRAFDRQAGVYGRDEDASAGEPVSTDSKP